MERLSTQDASFFYMENAMNHMSIALLGVFDGPAPVADAIETMALSKLDRAPRLRQ
jgi:hypothetical protein